MTKEEKHINNCMAEVDAYYEEYKRLDGKASKDRYSKILRIFFKITTGWIGGDRYMKPDGTYCNNREEELWLVCIEARIKGPEYYRIFESIDNIHHYS